MRMRLLLPSLLILASATAHASTFTVALDGSGDTYSIQEAVDWAIDGDTVVIKPGMYQQSVYMDGRAITLRSTNPADADVVRNTFINGQIICYFDEGPQTVITGLTIGGDMTAAGGRIISSASTSAAYPAIWGDIVVWQELSPSGMDWDIQGMNLATGERFAVCTDAGNQQNPAIYGSMVVWEDDRNGDGDIYGRDLTSGGVFPVCVNTGTIQMHPSIYNGTVAWADNRSSTFAIYYKVMPGGGETLLTTASGDKDYPWVYGNMVVWQDWRDPSYQSDIYYKIIGEPTDTCIAKLGSLQSVPRLFNEILVWEDWASGHATVNGKNVFTGADLAIANPGFSPAIYESMVVYVQTVGSKYQIMMKDLIGGMVMPVSPVAKDVGHPAIYGEHIVWVENGKVVLGPTASMLMLNAYRWSVSDGITCLGSSPTITGNNIVGCGNSAVYGDYGALPEISGNLMRANAYGVYGCDGIVSGNAIDQSVNAGIEECGGQVMNNTITGGGNGVASCGGTISGNYISENSVGVMMCSGPVSANRINKCSTVAVNQCSGPITGNVISGNYQGVQMCTSTTIANNTIVGIRGNAIDTCTGSTVKNNIIANNYGYGISGACNNSYNGFWYNSSGSFYGNYGKTGDKYANPQFAADGHWTPESTWYEGDYHLKSKYGRWDPATSSWVIDSVMSPFIDAGDPADSIGYEPAPNGGRINMGAYGGTTWASKSASAGPEPLLECASRPTADISGDCRVNMVDYAMFASQWLTCGLADQSKCW